MKRGSKPGKKKRKSLVSGIRIQREKKKASKEKSKEFINYKNQDKPPENELLSIMNDIENICIPYFSENAEQADINFEFKELSADLHDCSFIKDPQEYPDYGIINDIKDRLIIFLEDWLSEVTETENDRVINKLVDLQPKTKQWLKKNVLYWDYYFKAAKNTLRISKTAKVYDASRLTELVREQLNIDSTLFEELFPETTEPTNDVIFQTFFETQYTYDYRFARITNKAINELQDELKLRILYLDQFKISPPKGYPKKWMTNDKKIRENLKKKGNKLFYSLFELLVKNKIRYTQSNELAEKRGWDLNLVLVEVNRESIANEFKINKQTLHNYLKEMSRLKIISKQGKVSENGLNIYCLGKYTQGKARFPRPVYWLKNNNNMKNALRTFTAFK